MGRRISKEFLHPSILEGVNNKIGNLDSLETDAKGNMVQAINELVEKLDNSAEIENGKELIANAVGEPLTAEESFEEMRNDINGLLSTFKTNMMNNGVAVESGDKFKSLIDKIATMVEEGSNKGIKFASGTCDVTTNVGGSTTITTNLDFVPTYIFCYALVRRYRGQYNNVDGSLPNLYISNISSMPSTSGYPVSVSNITANDFRVSGGVYNSVEEYKTSVNVTKWYAIGIGEEDTTLRDSLASILQEEGVSVTEEDDMADLISKVDEEFDRKNEEMHIIKSGTSTKVIKSIDVESLTVDTNLDFIPKEIICTIKSCKFNYTSGSYANISTPFVIYSKYNKSSSNSVRLDTTYGAYGLNLFISSISQSNFIVSISDFTGSSVENISIEWVAIN